jgi:hypothetical protein
MNNLKLAFIMRSHSFASVLLLATVLSVSPQEKPDGQGFAAPEQAVQALTGALIAKDTNQLGVIFGSRFSDIINSDQVQATNEFKTFATALQETNSLVKARTNRMILQYGSDKSLFPIPLVSSGGKWYFDTPAGVEELINRRIGRNELDVLEIVRTYVEAQREYAEADRDDDEVLEYAQKFRSAPGKKDGLFWDPDLDGTISPLGPMVAEAEDAGYQKRVGVSRQSFHGYYFKILTEQGKHAPGGAYNYIINGNMIGGFALVAWPAEYGETGIMTFIVNQQGRVYQKDLGKKTDEEAEGMKAYEPDNSWSLSED